MKFLLAILFLIALSATQASTCRRRANLCARRSNYVLRRCLGATGRPRSRNLRFRRKCNSNRTKCCLRRQARRLVMGSYKWMTVYTVCYFPKTVRRSRRCRVRSYGAGRRRLCCSKVTATFYRPKKGTKYKSTLRRRCRWVGRVMMPSYPRRVRRFCQMRSYTKAEKRKLCCKRLYMKVNGKWLFSKLFNCVWQARRSCKKLPNWAKRVRFLTAAQLKARAIRQCRHWNRFVEYSCVKDASMGLKKGKAEYNKLVNVNRKVRASHKLVCYSWGDPHYQSFFRLRFNVYKKRGWRTLLSHNGLVVKTHVDFKHHWGLKGVNDRIYVKLGKKVTRFNEHRMYFNNGLQWRRHGNRYYLEAPDVNIRVDLNRNHINIYLTSYKGRIAGCKGDCCQNRRLRSKKLGDIHPSKVKFESVCIRKHKALRFCRHAVRTYRSNWVNKGNWVRRCFSNQRNQY